MTAQSISTNQYQQAIFPKENTSLVGFTTKWAIDFLKWWYVTMPVWYILSLRRTLTIIDDQYSISLLIRNFFVPWHRDYSAVGFFIGLVMKVLFLPIGVSIFLLTTIFYILFIFLWTAIPVVTILGIVLTPFIKAL